MKKIAQMMSLSFIWMVAISSFNGCTQKETIIKYVKVPCPKLQIIDKNITQPKELHIKIER